MTINNSGISTKAHGPARHPRALDLLLIGESLEVSLVMWIWIDFVLQLDIWTCRSRVVRKQPNEYAK
jgi:hypothetical protein